MGGHGPYLTVSPVPILTKAEQNGLEATSRGDVIRTHTGSAYTITGPVGSKTLWRLVRAAMIADGPRSPLCSKTPMVLTTKGQSILAKTKLSRLIGQPPSCVVGIDGAVSTILYDAQYRKTGTVRI